MINESLIQEPLTVFCYSLAGFKQRRPLNKGQRRLKLENREYVSVMAVSLVELCFYVHQTVYLLQIIDE